MKAPASNSLAGTDELILIKVLPLWKPSTCARGNPLPVPADFVAVLLNIFALVRNRKHLADGYDGKRKAGAKTPGTILARRAMPVSGWPINAS
jgi:hypothetical protein